MAPAPLGGDGDQLTGPLLTENSVELALLDRHGVIVGVNQAWQGFCQANGGDPNRAGVGVSYLDICAASEGNRSADRVAGAIRAALRGELPAPEHVEVPCHSQHLSRWFDTLVSSRLDDDGRCLGATVTFTLALATPPPLDRPPGPPSYRDPHDVARLASSGHADLSERLGDGFAQVVLDLVPSGILVVDDEGLIVGASRRAEEMFRYGRDTLVGASVERLLPGPLPPAGRVPPFDSDPRPAPWLEWGPCVSGVRADGSALQLGVELGSVALSRGAGTVIVVTDLSEVDPASPADRLPGLEDRAQRMIADLDRVVRRLFACGLSVSGMRGRSHLGGDLTADLHRVTEELDGAVQDIRRAVLRHRSN